MSNHAHLAELSRFPDAEPDRVRPTSLTLDLSHCCPFRCPGCIEGKAMSHSHHTSLLGETACHLISQFSDQGGKEVLLYGGEPTAHPQFDKVVLHAADCIGLIRVVTNGAFLEKRCIAEALWAAADNAKVTVRVSLNAGTPQTHEALHRVRGFFLHVVRGMKMLTAAGSHVQLGVSYLVEEANASEVVQAYDIAVEVGATDFWLRPKTGLHGIGLLPLSQTARQAVLEAVDCLQKRRRTQPAPRVHVKPWYLQFLKANRLPETTKPYPACYFCAASRLVLTPPEPGVFWACPYWRAHPRFHVANLSEVTFGSLAKPKKEKQG